MNVQPYIVTQLSDFEILDRVLSGETALYEIIIRRYNSLIYKVGRSYGLQHEDVQDLMQECFITSYRQLHSFKRQSAYSTWLVRIMINKCLYRMKSLSKHTTISVTDEPAVHSTSFLPSVEKQLLQKEMKSIMEAAIEKLPEHYRLVFLLREMEGLSVAETAGILSITSVNVKVRLNRARALLRECMEKWYSKTNIYEFNLKYCSAVVAFVLEEINNAGNCGTNKL